MGSKLQAGCYGFKLAVDDRWPFFGGGRLDRFDVILKTIKKVCKFKFAEAGKIWFSRFCKFGKLSERMARIVRVGLLI